MKPDELNAVVKKITRFRARLTQEGIIGDHQQVILKIYIQDLTSRININLLGVI